MIDLAVVQGMQGVYIMGDVGVRFNIHHDNKNVFMVTITTSRCWEQGQF
jgi:hypothetical protein